MPAAVPAPAPVAADGTPLPSLEAHRARLFRRRGRALFVVRCALFACLALVALQPHLAASLGLDGAAALRIPLGLALGAVASRLLLDGPLGRPATFVSLCLDAAGLAHLLLASGGLFSPLLGTQLVLLAACTLLFSSRLALLPALLVLPAAAGFGPGAAGADLFLLAWYAALDVAVVAALLWLQDRDERAHAADLALTEARRAHAVLEERHRLSREIHDGVGASLAALVLQAELAGARVDEAARAEVGGLRGTAEEAIDELRRSLRMLRGDFDAARAVEEHCRKFGERTGIAVAFRFEGSGCPLAAQASLSIFRVLQEALHNALRHGRARVVEVALELAPAGALLRIRDDGVGFEPGELPPGHYGLRGMRERAAASGGSLEVRSAPGAGTEIELRLPPAGARGGAT